MKRAEFAGYFLHMVIISIFFIGCTKDFYQKEFPQKQTCPGVEAVEYGGVVYPTILIGNQCWMAKNINIGKRIDHIFNTSDNDTIEKYCYYNKEEYCDFYGGLYQWDEMMQYASPDNVQGICPEGWRIPKLADYGLLITYTEGVVKPLKKEFDCWDGIAPLGQYDTCANIEGQTGFDLLAAGWIDMSFTGQNKFFRLEETTRLWVQNSTYLYVENWSFGFRIVSSFGLQNSYLSVRCIKDEE